MRAAIHQPNFLPWIGYFHKIAQVDKFVLFDDVQLPRGKSFCTRTKVLINGNDSWIGIPVCGKSDYLLIKDTTVNKSLNWKAKHLKTLEQNYIKCQFFNEIFSIIEEIYKTISDYLIDYNIPLIIHLSRYLGINADFKRSSEILPNNNRKGLERLIEINEFLGADTYVSGSGSGSKRYIREEEFEKKNITLKWQDFEPFDYPQINRKIFFGGLSIIDLLFNCGKKSIDLLVSHEED